MAAKKVNTTPVEPVEETVEEVKAEPKPKKAEPKVTMAAVNAEYGLNVRIEPSTDADIIEVIPFEEKVTVEEKKTEWSKVTTANGNHGFVMTQYLKF